MILCIILVDVRGRENLVVKCVVTEELENNKPAKKKNYLKKDVLIFIDRVNLWLSDISYNKWQNKNKESRGKIEKKFVETEKIIVFNFYEFYEENKETLELSFNIMFEKLGGHISFIKYYHDHNGKTFFSSEIRGQCFPDKQILN